MDTRRLPPKCSRGVNDEGVPLDDDGEKAIVAISTASWARTPEETPLATVPSASNTTLLLLQHSFLPFISS